MSEMILFRSLLKCILLLVICQLAAAAKEACGADQHIRLEVPDETCELVQGRVQFCEEREGERAWRHVCDSNFTEEDAQVLCRSLGHSGQGADSIIAEGQTEDGAVFGVTCSGTENDFRNCTRIQAGQCEGTIAIRCATTDCNSANTTSPSPSDSNNSTNTTSDLVPGSGTSPLPQTTPIISTVTSPAGTTTTEDPDTATEEPSILSTPTLYYLIGGLIAFVLLIVLIVICSVFCCCGFGVGRKDVSPTDVEKTGDEALSGEPVADGTLKKDYVTTHHQLQQSSQPIYEAIQGNEDSSSASQGSPASSKPVNTAELYSTLDQSHMHSTYAQIEPFIASAAGASNSPTISSPSGPDPNSYYQALDHRTGSMKRSLPSTPVQLQAVNATALAMARGEVGEGELASMTRRGSGAGLVGSSASLPRNNSGLVGAVGSSTSLPRNTGYTSTANHQLPPVPHRSPLDERVELSELARDAEVSEEQQPNIYHILEPPPPAYNTLEQLDEISQVSTTAAVGESGNSRPSRVSQQSGVAATRKRHSSSELSPRHYPPQRSHEGSPALPPHQHHPRSATLPSNHSSPRSSRNSSVSSSPHTNRSSRSPLNTRASQGGHHGGSVKSNKYSDSPSLSSRGPSSSPQIGQSLSKSNRFSNQSDGTEGNITLV